MHIGIMSDSHGNQRIVAEALRLFERERVEAILHCGDIDDADTMLLFTDLPAHFVLGNCDYDVAGLTRTAKIAGVHLHGRFASLSLGSVRIAMIHGDDERRMAAEIAGGEHDYLFYGHTHQAKQHRVARSGDRATTVGARATTEGERATTGTLVVNPGALHRARPKTIALLDTEGGEVRIETVAE